MWKAGVRRGGCTWAALLLGLLAAGCGDWNAMPARGLQLPVMRTNADWLAYSPDGRGVPAEPPANNFVSIHLKVGCACYAGSRISDSEALGGFGGCDNYPQPVARSCTASGCYLLAQPEYVWQLQGEQAMRVVLVNRTRRLLAFRACDSRLAIVQEALAPDGVWTPVEYAPESYCGNSSHRVFLPAGEFWSFRAWRYRGPYATRLRFRLQLSAEEALISNDFEGSIDPAQFGEKEGHSPTGLMDPRVD